MELKVGYKIKLKSRAELEAMQRTHHFPNIISNMLINGGQIFTITRVWSTDYPSEAIGKILFNINESNNCSWTYSDDMIDRIIFPYDGTYLTTVRTGLTFSEYVEQFTPVIRGEKLFFIDGNNDEFTLKQLEDEFKV